MFLFFSFSFGNNNVDISWMMIAHDSFQHPRITEEPHMKAKLIQTHETAKMFFSNPMKALTHS